MIKKIRLIKQGSGVIIKDKGFIVTNYHVFAGGEKIEVVHNNKVIPYAEIIGIDIDKDVVILKLDDKKYPKIKIGDSKNLVVGQRVYAIGSPLGLENTISEGIISGLRSYDEMGRRFIQMTASISHGSSGGAVVNDRGELLGISTLTAKEGQNLNFAIPIDEVLEVDISSYSKNNAYKYSDWFNKGLESAENRKYYDAIRYFSMFIEKNPNFAAVYYNRAMVKISTKDYKGVVLDLNSALEIDPDFVLALFLRGVAMVDLKLYKSANDDFTKVIMIDPYFAKAYYHRGMLRTVLEDDIGALQDYNKTLELNPDNEVAYFLRGSIKYSLGDKIGACLDWSKSGELGNYKAYKILRKYCK